ncbi:MAG TPA: hypothetical protein VJA27_04200 [Patescibacteria group bacterium]|nr:hypothetical protein [Patescibacteria group bacterium]
MTKKGGVIIVIIGLLLATSFVTLASPEEPTRDELEQQLRDIEHQIAQFEKELAVTKTEKNTLANKIKRLKTEQANLRLQIQSTALKITDLKKKVTTTEQKIRMTTLKIDQLRAQIAELLRLLNQKDTELLLESLASGKGLANVFTEMKNYSRLSLALNELLDEVKKTKQELTQQKEVFAEQQEDSVNLLALQTVQQKELGNSLGEQAQLLQETRGKEELYQQALSDSKKRAAQIRNRIYELLGGGKQISFGEAVQIADWVSKQTGVRTAFLLAILTQESNLGKNVGTCNRSGDPPEKSWRVVMKPERDHKPFLTITEELGRDPDVTPVSCPMKDKNGNQVGWGGAMGPAQFIPSTWMGYRDKVTKLTGKPANPWDIRDAFIAAAIKLKADGANGTEDGEWKAAMRYFSGSTNTKYRFYGDNVLKLAEKYQNDIDELNN